MSGYNPNYQQQQGQGPQQGQFGNALNMRPQMQRVNSGSSLASVQPYPPNATQAQGNINFNPNANHLQQLTEFHNRQQQQQAYTQQRQPAHTIQQGQQGQFGPPLMQGGNNGNYQPYGNVQPVQHQAALAFQQQQNLARQQAQHLAAARQVQAQAQATQVPYRSPAPSHISLPPPPPSLQRPSIPSNQANPMPMQRTFSNQSNGGGSGQQQQAPTQARPQQPVSGYQLGGSFGMRLNTIASGDGTGSDSVQDLIDPPRGKPLPHPLPLTQLNDPSALAASASAAPSSARPSTADSDSPKSAEPKATAPPPAPKPMSEYAKRKRRKEEGTTGTGKARGAGKKAEEKTVPVVYFTGVEKAKEDPVEKKGEAERPREAARPTPASAAVPSTGATERRRAHAPEGMRGSMRSDIAKLMYAAGDVAEPSMDTVDYMEDLVVEFLSDLCRPAPPTRTAPGALHTAPPIDNALIRHRLLIASARRPHMAKYAARFDYMYAMDLELAKAKGAMQPSHEDLVNTVGREYLEIGQGQEGGDGDVAGGGGGGERGAGTGRRGRPKKMVEPGQERRKPGPKKGWKKEGASQGPEGKKRGPYKKRVREGSGVGTVKGESQ
ncbi:uncharacterized protein MKK02DRAFT_39637 [Dioszegia hungarica]|uniref:Transcription initiation factor TFIID subunit 13 n=1 Tax=Dioszegia hungarica TaxID=4972 RepID=A0AA38HD59_9TREE|nr:uncharacterized protein MKK02DRAFT_39637 [Dioszegia hungarica]KAI9639338.1 hypothetical protein MKK02DRAFT_39637 [Dioszegia hungarica]